MAARFILTTFRRADEVLAEPDPYLRAFFSFKDKETGILYNGWRLLEGTYGLYVAPPQKAYTYKDKESGEQKKGCESFVERDSTKDNEGKRVYTDLANEWWNEITEVASAKFQNGGSSTGPKKEAAPAKKASGRGPAKKTAAAAVAPEDDDLPF